MNLDDFEKKLRRQDLRQVPDAWRETILRKAEDRVPSGVKSPSMFLQALLAPWHELIQPSRYAWSGMAAIWVVLFIVNAGTHLGESPKGTSLPARVVVERVRSFAERRR